MSFAVGGSDDSEASSADTAAQDEATDAAATDGSDGTSDQSDAETPDADAADDSAENDVAAQSISYTTGTTINCYVSDGTNWVKIDQYKESSTYGNPKRIATKATDLEEIFGAYGFKADEYTGAMWFPQTDNGTWIDNATDYLWPDATAQPDTDGNWWILTTTDNKRTVDLFYTNQVEANVSKYKLTGGKTDGSILRTNSEFLTDCKMDAIYYNVHITDPNNLFQGQDSPVKTMSVEKGGTITVTLPTSNGTYVWTAYDDSGEAVETLQPTSSDATSATYTLTDVQCSYRFVPVSKDDVLTVRCCVMLNGSWTSVATLSTAKTYNGRFYLTAAEFEHAFGAYGFHASDVETVTNKNQNMLPHYIEGDSVAWFDALPFQTASGTWNVPLAESKYKGKVAVALYTPGVASVTMKSNGSATLENAKVGSEFYSVSVKDPSHAFDASQLPEQVVARSGNSASITVPVKEETDWTVYSDGTALSESDYTVETSADGTTATYTFNNITHQIELVVASSNLLVQYVTTLNGHFENLANEVTAAKQVVMDGRDGMINGKVRTGTDPLEEVVTKGETYTLLNLDSDTAWSLFSSADNNQTEKEKKYIYTFQGWQVGDDKDNIIKPGSQLTYDQLIEDMDGDGVVHLTARWEARTSTSLSTTVNFYVRLDCEIVDNKSDGVPSTGVTSSNNYTKSVFATRMFGLDTLNGAAVKNKGNQNVVQGETGENAYAVDTQLRQSVTTPIHYDGGTSIGKADIQLEAVPSDEAVLSAARAQVNAGKAKITIDGTEIPASQLTSDNFTVRWFVLKYETSDGWHIDGVLVAKSGRLVVTKTFAGDEDAFNEIWKNQDFHIDVTHEENGQTVTDYTLTLNSLNAEGRDGMTGYDGYDAATKTFTWILEGRQGRTYTLKEENYALDTGQTTDTDGNQATTWNSSHSYQIHDSPGGTNDTNGWVTYDPAKGVQVRVTSYASDVPDSSCQTVAFLNTYVQSGLLTVQKVDTTTGNGLSGVSFRVSHEDGTELTLYRNEAKNLYSTSESRKGESGWTALTEPVVTTDQNGMFFIELAIVGEDQTQAEYLLEESVPTGYEGPTKITVSVNGEGKVTAASAVTDATLANPPEGGWISGQDTFTLTVRNHSKRLLELTAEKKWADATADSYKKPVQVRLARNGTLLEGDAYTQELNADNGWKYTWKDLPLFVDGHPAQYTVREVAIGDTAYDPGTDSTDGYADYQVSYDNTLYWSGDDDSNATTDSFWKQTDGTTQFADHARITVHNTVSSSAFSFTKVNEDGKALSGAVFEAWDAKSLNDDPSKLVGTEVEPVAKAVSDANGVVSFGELSPGTYYVRETEAPAGYDLLYTRYLKVVITNGLATITQCDLLSDEDEGEAFDGNFMNTSAMHLVIQKLDREDKTTLLSGATFKVVKNNTLYGAGSFTTDDSGTVELRGLPEGDYLIEETEPPTGYRLPQDSIIVHVADGKMTIVGDHEQNHCELVVDPSNPSIYTLKVYDPPIYDLPTAGGIGIYPLLAVGTAAMCTAAGGMIVIRRKRSSGKRERR